MMCREKFRPLALVFLLVSWGVMPACARAAESFERLLNRELSGLYRWQLVALPAEGLLWIRGSDRTGSMGWGAIVDPWQQKMTRLGKTGTGPGEHQTIAALWLKDGVVHTVDGLLMREQDWDPITGKLMDIRTLCEKRVRRSPWVLLNYLDGLWVVSIRDVRKEIRFAKSEALCEEGRVVYRAPLQASGIQNIAMGYACSTARGRYLIVLESRNASVSKDTFGLVIVDLEREDRRTITLTVPSEYQQFDVHAEDPMVRRAMRSLGPFPNGAVFQGLDGFLYVVYKASAQGGFTESIVFRVNLDSGQIWARRYRSPNGWLIMVAGGKEWFMNDDSELAILPVAGQRKWEVQ